MSDHRIIGAYDSGRPGPVVVFTGGIHGNEPAGVIALQRVYQRLLAVQAPVRGKILFLAGNMAALHAGKRYIDQDLNRLWARQSVTHIRAKAASERDSEERELMELLALIEPFGEGKEDRYFFDFHTTSGEGGCFVVSSGRPENQMAASFLHVPVIYGLATSMSGTTNRYMDENGWRGIGFEAGQHADPGSADRHEAAAWLLLESCGCLSPAEIPGLEVWHERLIRAAKGLPQHLEVTYRHHVAPEDQFVMHKGFETFSPVKQGEPLACDVRGEVRSPSEGYLLMPLYQKQGEDGFFIVKRLT